jgi:hypothetical protein
MPVGTQERRPHRVISGGQTGVDRAALDTAIALGIDHGGWCPRGRLAEDGRIADRYQLVETASPEYAVRTEQNVIDSEGTLILYRRALRGGTELTYRLALKHARPHLLIDLETEPDPADAREWIHANNISILNVAGPRESSAPGIARQSQHFLERVLATGGSA